MPSSAHSKAMPSSASSWNPQSELDLAFRMGTTAELGVREGGMVQTPTPPTKMDRDRGAADSGVHKGAMV